jgi:thiol:disulfide interchange protein DsbD
MLGIVFTFTFLGMLLAILLGASGANQLAANPYVNLFIGFLFIYFALSLFGFFEIELPEFLRRFSLEREDSEGYVGILFMALTFTLTSFTCTVQFMGLILVAAAQGEWFWPIIGMLIFSLAFASPFFFLALFPHYLTKLPQSGNWLNSVKVIMGFLELAAAFKFISNTDLVWNWDIFTYEIVLFSWSVIMFLCFLYLLGLIRFKNDSKISFSSMRLAFAIPFLLFSLYLGSGNFGYKINGTLESYLPPKKTHSNLNWVTSLDEGLNLANLENKKIFIDFTGVTCTNCRWMERNIFTDKSVEELMKEFILVSLYTDAGENYLQKREYQINRFKTAALPYYVILDKNDFVIGEFPGMSRNVNDFQDFLRKGLN